MKHAAMPLEATENLRAIVHELAEALTAAGGYLDAAKQTADAERHREGIEGASGQVVRANEATARLRVLLS